LIQSLDQIKSSKVYRSALWILGEYCDSLENIDAAVAGIKSILGELPLTLEITPESSITTTTAAASPTVAYSGPRVLADGTYATSTALEVSTNETPASVSLRKSSLPPLRHILVINKDFFLASVLATTLSKLTLRHKTLTNSKNAYFKLHAWSLLCLTSILRYMETQSVGELDDDSYERVCLCFNLLASEDEHTQEVYLNSSRQSFAQYLSQVQEQKSAHATENKEVRR
jgi:coatomer subunit beta